MERNQVRECSPVLQSVSADRLDPRTRALREARALILEHATSTYRGGLIERSDGITEVLVDFDLRFPEALE